MTVTGAGDWLYAVGDVCGRALLTHMGKYQARVAGEVIAARAEGRPTDGSRHRDVADHANVPAVDLHRPARSRSVGLTEEARPRPGTSTWKRSSTTSPRVSGASLLRDD